MRCHLPPRASLPRCDLILLQNKPELYMYGMLCALLATGIWLLVATYFEVTLERCGVSHREQTVGGG